MMFGYASDKDGNIYCLDTGEIQIPKNSQKDFRKINSFGFDSTFEKEIKLNGKQCIKGIYKLPGEFINEEVSVFLDNDFHVVAIYSLLQDKFIPMLTKEQAKKLLGDNTSIDEISLLKSTIKLKCQTYLDKENLQKQQKQKNLIKTRKKA